MAKVASWIIQVMFFALIYSLVMLVVKPPQDFPHYLLWSIVGFIASWILSKIVVRMIRGGKP